MNLSRGRACDGKKRHRTRGAADAAARRLRARGVRRIAPYACMWCGSFHVGHTPYPEEQS